MAITQDPNDVTAVADEIDNPNQPVLDVIATDTDATDTDEATMRLIRKFEAQAKRPDFVQADVDKMASDRKYVHTDVMLPLVKDAVCTNLVLRNQYIRLTQTYAKDPDLSVQPKRMIAPVPAMDAIVDQASAMAVEDLYAKSMTEYHSMMHRLGQFGQTIEILVKHFADECDLRSLAKGMIQDCTTVGIAWLKVSWQENMGQDPVGNRRVNDFQDTVNRLTRLSEEHDKGDFDENDERYRQMIDLTKNIQAMVQSEAWKQMAYGDGSDPREIRWAQGEACKRADITEIPHFRGFNADPIMPEDVSLDWKITRPEEFRKARWFDHRVKKTWDDIAEEFGLTEEEVNMHRRADRRGLETKDPRIGSTTSNMTTADPADRAENEGLSDDEVTVHERHDREQNRIYIWVEGSDRFLDDYEPEVTSKFWFPFFPLYFNRVTGKFLPISDTQLLRSLNDEFNMLRTHDREGRRAAYNKYIFAKGALSDEEKEYLRTCPPEGVVEVEKADEVQKYFSRVLGSNYNPALYDTGKVRMDIDAMAATPSSARGTVGNANFAIEEKNAADQMAQDADRYRESVENLFQDIFTHMADILVQVFPESNAKAIAGPGAYFPYTDRETLWRNLQLEIEAGSTGKPDAARKMTMMKMMGEIIQLAASLDPASGYRAKLMRWAKDLLSAQNINAEPEDYIEEVGLVVPEEVRDEAQRTAMGGTPAGAGAGAPQPVVVDPSTGQPTPPAAQTGSPVAPGAEAMAAPPA